MGLELTPSTLPCQTRQTPKTDLFYTTPYHPDGQTFDCIPKDFLEGRLSCAIEALRNRVLVTTSKHYTAYQAGTLLAIESLQSDIQAVINSITTDKISSHDQLQRLCKGVAVAMRRFKENPDKVRINNRIATIFWGVEREVISTLFSFNDAGVEQVGSEKVRRKDGSETAVYL